MSLLCGDILISLKCRVVLSMVEISCAFHDGFDPVEI